MKKKSHDEAVRGLNQSIRFCTPEDVADAIHEFFDVDQVIQISRMILAMKESQLNDQIAADQEGGA